MAATEKTKTTPCDGCGKPLANEMYSGDDGRMINVGPELVLRVCGGGRSHRGVKRECLLKALQKQSVCPGCGKPVQDWPVQNLCDNCGKSLDEIDDVRRDASRARTSVKLPTRDVVWSTKSHDHHATEAVEEAVLAVAKVLSPEVRGGKGGYDVVVKVTEEQAQAVRELGEALKKIWQAGHEVGRKEGRSLLLGLATGEVTVEQFSERDVQRAREKQA